MCNPVELFVGATVLDVVYGYGNITAVERRKFTVSFWKGFNKTFLKSWVVNPGSSFQVVYPEIGDLGDVSKWSSFLADYKERWSIYV